MIYKTFQDKQLSMLGFGTMRLPLLADGSIDQEQTEKMTDYAISHGVNYFDTAWPYHGGNSEIVIGKILSKYPRSSYYLADKYPGHQISDSYNPAEIFERQLEKCGVDYFDFYLLHNVYEQSIDVYFDPKWGIVDYFLEQKRLGRIKHLGFSCHGGIDCLNRFLDRYGKYMEFCQIQLNWMDWTLQNAKTKVDILNAHGIPIWVMEPVRGGRLCGVTPTDQARLAALRDESVPAWGFRFVQSIDGVAMILSGMSNMEQMMQNIDTFDVEKPLNNEEFDLLLDVAEKMKVSVPCTACKYCVDHCPIGLDIPKLIATYNELLFAPVTNSAMWIESLPDDKKPTACLACGNCARMCPQKINVPEVMQSLAKKLETIPKWADICREREEAAKRLANKK